MKLCIFINVTELVVGFEKLAHTLSALAQTGNQPRSQFRDADSVDLKRFTKIVEVLHFFRGKKPQVGAFTCFDADQALGMQVVESFSDRRLTDSELFGQKLFGQPGSLIKVFTKDVSLDALVC